LRAEKKALDELTGSEKKQWEKIAAQIKELREKYGKKTPLGKRRTDFAEAPEHDEAAIEEAMVIREPVTVVVSDKGWVRALRGTSRTCRTSRSSRTTSSSSHSSRRRPRNACCSPQRALLHHRGVEAAGRARPRRAGAPVHRSRTGRRHRHDVSLSSRRKFIVASHQGGVRVAEDECLGTTRKGKTVLNVRAPDEARAVCVVEGEQVATIGENRKMVIFPVEQLPEMARGSGVRLQRYKDGGLSDVKTFKGADGLGWTDGAGRAFS